LHSVLGDLWVMTGIPGLALVAVLLSMLARNLAISVSAKTASALVVWATCLSLWNVFFGPLSTSASVLILALGLGAHRAVVSRPVSQPDARPTGAWRPPTSLGR
jgi:hypothetical protein